jgi:putative OmpL-like beta-barrel porin-2
MIEARRVLLAALFFVAATARAEVHAWADAYYAWNGNHPEPRLNFFSGTGTSAHRAGQIALGVAAFEIVRDAKPFGFHLTLVAGDSADVVHSGEPHPRRRTIRNLYQASVRYDVPAGRGLALEAGVYPSHIGFEGFFTKDNWNYSRGWLAELSPYYQTGIKASYAWSDRWSGQVHLLRGWQRISDNNAAPSWGTQVAYNGPRLAASFNTFAGPELPRDTSHLRTFGDLVATWKATPKLTLGGSIDRGRQEYAGDAAANWLGIAVYGRYTVAAGHALALRAERFHDRDGGISGFAQTLTESTLTYELQPAAHLKLDFEARRDHSSAPLFGGFTNQTLAIAGVVVTY